MREYLSTENKGNFNSFDLGFNLGESAAFASISGLAAGDYSISTNDAGHSVISLTEGQGWLADYSVVQWDSNWGLENTPTKAWHSEISSTMGLYGSRYDDGERIVLSVSGTEGASAPINLYATVNSEINSSNAGGRLERDSWLEVTGGNFGVIAGIHNNNWQSGALWTLVGDTHLMMRGGSVNDIIGFNYKDGYAPAHEGNSYITVEAGATVSNSIIGGGVARHNNGSTLTGNTNIFVYSVLDSNPASLTGEFIGTRYNAIIGGHAYGSNQVVSNTLNGSTNIMVDVSGYSGEVIDFVKNIYGGNADSKGCTNTITGSTNVSIDAVESVRFTGNILGGSFVNVGGGIDAINGNSSLTINGGSFSGSVVGGSYKNGASGTNSIGGSTSLTINGGSFDGNVIAGSYKNEGNGGSVTIGGDSTLTINGGTFNGGSDVFLTAGSYIQDQAATMMTTVAGTASVILNGGTINRDVYAAGIMARWGENATVGASLVEVDAAATLGTITLSGGYAATSTNEVNETALVSGNRTLSLRDGVELASSVTVKDFSHIAVAQGSASLAATSLQMSSFTKTGSGALALAGGESGLALTLQQGSLALDHVRVSSLAYTGSEALEVTGSIRDAGGGNRLTFNVPSSTGEAVPADLEVSGIIGTGSTSFGIIKAGAGTLLLSGSNLFQWGVEHNEGRLIAGNDQAFGDSSLKVASGAVLEIAKDVYVTSSVNANGLHSFGMADGSELVLHSLREDVAALTSRAAGYGASNTLGDITLTLAGDMLLEGGTYKVASGLMSVGNITLNTSDSRLNISNLGLNGNTLEFTVAAVEAGELTWANEDESACWQAGAQLWGMDSSSENVVSHAADTVIFGTEGTRQVNVDASGVDVAAVKVQAEGYAFSGGAVRADSVDVQTSASLGAGASLELGEVFTVSRLEPAARGRSAAADAMLSNVAMSVNEERTAGSISGMSGEMGQIEGAEIAVMAGKQLSMERVVLDETSSVTGDHSMLAAEELILSMGTTNTSAIEQGVLAEGTELMQLGIADSVFTLSEQLALYSVSCTALENLTVVGSSFTLDLSGYVDACAAQMAERGYLAIRFVQEDGSGLTTFSSESGALNIQATLNGVDVSDVFVAKAEGYEATTLYVAVPRFGNDAVPEPATATLSLLALVALAARRRRR